MHKKPLFSIIIPIYNSADIVFKTVTQTLQYTEKHNLNIELILINDGSRDTSWSIIKKIAKNNNKVKSIDLIKNYGQHSAILCGFENAKGDFVITMDDDLQNPPSQIIHLINKITNDEEYDLVIGKFIEKKHSLYRRLGSMFVGYLNEKIFNKPKNITLTNFRIIKKSVIERVLDHKTAYPYIPGMLLIYATNISNVMVEHHKRSVGKSNYNNKKILSLMSNLLVNYSSYPLKLLSFIGIFISSVSFFVGSFFLISALIGGSNVSGWTSIFVLVSFLGGFIIIVLGVMGEYLSRILNQMSGSKNFYAKEIVSK